MPRMQKRSLIGWTKPCTVLSPKGGITFTRTNGLPRRVGRGRWTAIGLLRAYLFVGAVLLVLASLLYTHSLVVRLEEEPRTFSRIFAKFSAAAAIPATQNPALEGIIREVVQGIKFPFVMTDVKGVPRAWRKIGIDPYSVPDAVLDSLSSIPGYTPPENVDQLVQQIRNKVRSLDREHEPIQMVLATAAGDSVVVGYVHYGESSVVHELRFMPMVQLGLISLFIAIGFIGFRTIKANEERRIWVGMAKETAHQLGTPISSLLGWLALLAERKNGNESGPILIEMEEDLKRLNNVATRFSHIGSIPKLELSYLEPLLREVASYFRRRLPQSGRTVTISEEYEDLPRTKINSQLLGWALENLVKNAVDALDLVNSKGEIHLAARRGMGEKTIEILVSDNGRGMTREEQRKIFAPGYTTKKVGWGLGLVLARRIVEDYHGGSLRILTSEPGSGTTMLVELPS
jgi:two-component system, NtrC family, sensor histidine kinase KinB